MRKKINYKKNEVQLKKKLIKPVNQSNLDYLSKLANHVNVIERQNKKIHDKIKFLLISILKNKIKTNI
jgi:hypothetical protein